jgi:predicted ester cyclase
MRDHKNTVRKFYEAIGNGIDQTVIPEMLDEQFSFRGSLGLVKRGRYGFSAYMAFVRGALGEYRCEIVEMVAENDKVYARIRYSGVHRGELFGYQPTGIKLNWEGMALFTFADGKITELWVLGDVHSIMQQLSRHLDE